MKTIFSIARYEKNDDTFDLVGYDDYTITFRKGKSISFFRMVVDGFVTKQVVDLNAPERGIREKILSAIKEYKDYGNLTSNRVTKMLTLSYMKQFYAASIIKKVQKSLITQRKEMSRDVITEYELI